MESDSSKGEGFSFIFDTDEVLEFSSVCTGSESGSFFSWGKVILFPFFEQLQNLES